MTIAELITKVKQSEVFPFAEVIKTIDANYSFTPTFFKNGDVVNEENQNNGSCKVFSFAKMQHLTKEETLFLFGEHYQKVLETPNDSDHQNIRNFMNFGWDGIVFEKEALS
ncbi:HopJ type III effector protein [Flavobacterium channae]|uniref:HopJ type III effector protein n=1 Tax=Flavobacterium channae TaxID=2897181 RepID=UPI001E44B00F|nr:HopJ type III effector protein [Flavobacterium channae]UGS23872.1 HopJ type III effector protein [Flavobacterium channae]